MLVCPQCQFENPDNHKFCQKCGVSLTEVICPSCEATVPLDVEQCPYCGTSIGTTWRAIILTPPEMQPFDIAALMATQDATPVSAGDTETPTQYLDLQQRYQLLDPLPDLSATADPVEVRVIDCHPYQPTLLETLYSQQDTDGDEEADIPTAPGSSAPCKDEPSYPLFTIPPSAKTYLALQPQLHPALPQIHDAWEQGGRVVVLLEDRTTLPRLVDAWGADDVLPLQILHWFYQMTELWGLLEPDACRQSLIEFDNVRVDEDQLLYLQCLYFENPDHPLTLKDLGHFWQKLFQQSQRTQIGALAKLCQDLEMGEITELDDLKAQFEAIATEFQPDAPPRAMTAPSMPLPPPSSDDISNEPTMELSPGVPSNQQETSAVASSLPPGSARLELSELDDDLGGDGDDVPTVVLPMKLINLEEAGRTDVGRQRDHNEDCFSIQTQVRKSESPSGRTLAVKGLYILCDGMGGHAGGEVASALAVETLKKYFETIWQDQLPNESQIKDAVHLANKAIYDLNQQNDRSGSGRMGTTLVLVLVQDTQVAVAHVGDSRLYRFSRRRGLEQVTTDHEVGQREIQRGVEPAIAYARPDAYQLTQALGPRDQNFVNPDVQFIELNEDLLLLLCSDGLTDNDLLETHWRTHLEPLLSSQSNLEQGVSQLIDLANHYNGHDNITSVVIRAKVRPNLEQLKR